MFLRLLFTLKAHLPNINILQLSRVNTMACFCSCIWGNPDPGPVRLQEVQQVVLDTTKMGELSNASLFRGYFYDMQLLLKQV